MTPMEELREQAADAAWKAIYGPTADPHLNPEGRGFAGKVADAVLSALPAPVALPEAGEVERIVAWLRGLSDGYEKPFGLVEDHGARWALTHAANAIEAGGYRTSQPTPTEAPTAAAPDDAILREAQAIVGIANSYQRSSEPSAIVPISVLRAAAMIVNRLALAPMLAKVAAPDDGLMGRLKACPFCGSPALVGQTLDDAWYVMCQEDKCLRIDNYWPTKDEAVAAWNTRTPAKAGEDGVRNATLRMMAAATKIERDVRLLDLTNEEWDSLARAALSTIEEPRG